MITAADVKARMPEFAAIPDAEVNYHISYATRLVGSCGYPDYINDLLLYATGHSIQRWIETSKKNWSSMGAITQASEGEKSVSYAATAVSKSIFVETIAATKYGQRFLELSESMKFENYPFVVI